MQQRQIRIAVVAGEVSGDRLGAGLITELGKRIPNLSIFGIAGPRMIAAGCTPWYSIDALSVMGFSEVLGKLVSILRLRHELLQRLLADPPDLFVGIDAADFNLWLESRLRAAQIPVVHYNSPKIWAWRKNRIHKIAKSVDAMLCLFPFEVPLYKNQGISVQLVGHPLADAIPMNVNKQQARHQLQLGDDKIVVALLPGSRRAELQYMAESMVRTAQQLNQTLNNLCFIMPMANVERSKQLQQIIVDSGLTDVPIIILDGNSTVALAAADLAIVAAGTATLEAMLCRTPMVVIYRMARLSYWFGYLLRYRCPWVGLPNILAQKTIVPELIQHKATPEAITEQAVKLLQEPEAMLVEFDRIHKELALNADYRAAEAVYSFLTTHDLQDVKQNNATRIPR